MVRAATSAQGVLYAFIVLDNPVNSILDMQVRRGWHTLAGGAAGAMLGPGRCGRPCPTLHCLGGQEERRQEPGSSCHRRGPLACVPGSQQKASTRALAGALQHPACPTAPPRPPAAAQTVSFVGGRPVFSKYMDSFPFPFYIVLRDTAALPRTLADLIRQWFELSSG